MISMIDVLDNVLKKQYPLSKKLLNELNIHKPWIIGFSFETCGEYMQYVPNNSFVFVKIFVEHPQLVPALKHLLQYPKGGFNKPVYYKKHKKNEQQDNNIDEENVDPIPTYSKTTPSWCYDKFYITTDIKSRSNIEIYEGDVDFVIRFLIDNKIQPSNWLKINKGTYHVIIKEELKKTRCSIEIWVEYNNVNNHTIRDIPIPDLIHLTFDIECKTNGSRFPDPLRDPIVQISCLLRRQKKSNEYQIFVFSVGYIPPIDDTIIFWYKRESDMLQGIRDFILIVDPDVIYTYNGDYFDWPYLIARAKIYNFDDWGMMGRSIDKKLYSSSNTWKGITKTITHITGRINIDILRVILQEEKFEGNTLGEVSTIILGYTKEEFDVSLISKFQQTTIGRTKIAIYGKKDSYCTDRIAKKKNIFMFILEFQRFLVYQYKLH